MGQRHALWNLALNGLPAVGLFGVAGTLVARRYPMTFFTGAGAMCAVGLACITAAKLTVIRSAHLTSFGSERMSPRFRALYRIGYGLVVSGACAILLFALAWNRA